MTLSPRTILLFRLLLLVTTTVITWLAVTDHQYPVIDDIYDKFKHVFAFFVLAFLLDHAYPDSPFDKAKILPLFFYGMILEIIQHYLPFRYFSVLDLVADLLGIMLYVLAIPLFERLEKRE